MPTILILEEDDLIRGLLNEQLVGAGYDVQLGDPRQPPSARPVDDSIGLIIADICLPKDQGVERIGALKRAYPAASIIVISGRICSGVGGSAGAARWLGVHKVLSKPFTRADLLKAVTAVTQTPAEERAK